MSSGVRYGSLGSTSDSDDSENSKDEPSPCKKKMKYWFDNYFWGTLMISFLFFFSVIPGFFLICACIMPVVEYGEKPCVNGNYLNPFEQMWCSIPEPEYDEDYNQTYSVKVSFNSSDIKLYRVKPKNLPSESYVSQMVKEIMNVPSNDYVFYRFEAMKYSRVNGTIYSNDPDDDCYFMDHDDYSKFCRGDRTSYIELSKSSLKVFSTLISSDEYYFVIEHRKQGNSSATFNMSINYAIYNMSLVNPKSCFKNKCILKDVDLKEKIILENTGQKTYEAHVTVVMNINIITVVMLSIFVVLGIGLFIGGIWRCVVVKRRLSEKKKTALLENKTTDDGVTATPTPTTPEAVESDFEMLRKENPLPSVVETDGLPVYGIY